MFFFFKDTATTEIYTLSLHDALPILAIFIASYLYCSCWMSGVDSDDEWLTNAGDFSEDSLALALPAGVKLKRCRVGIPPVRHLDGRSEEHTSELQSLVNLVCRLLLEKKKENTKET